MSRSDNPAIQLNASEAAHRLASIALDRYKSFWWRVIRRGSPTNRIFFVIWGMYKEIYNGGFWQYFSNSTGSDVPFACEALTAIGATDAIPIIEAAISVVGRDVPWHDYSKRTEITYYLPQEKRRRLYDLDRRFNALIHDLPVLLYYYLLKHRNEFKAPAEFWEGVDIQ